VAKLEYFVAAETVIVDSDTNKTTIVNVLESIVAKAFPVIIPSAALVCLLRVGPDDYNKDFQLLIHLIFPDQQKHDFTINFIVPPGSNRHRILQRFSVMPIPSTGILRFDIDLNGEHAASHEVVVLQGEIDAEGKLVPTA
jgi:hypothetical protein